MLILIQQHIQKYINERYGTYSSKNARKFLESLFAEEIVAEQKRAQELFATTLPNSQQKVQNTNLSNRTPEVSSLDEALDGSLTSTEISQSIGVTQTDLSIPKENDENQESLDFDQNSQADPTILEVSQKTSVSLDQEKFKVPTIFGEDKPVPTKLESSITKAGDGGGSEIQLDMSKQEIEMVRKRETFSGIHLNIESSNDEGSSTKGGKLSKETGGTESKSIDIKLDQTGPDIIKPAAQRSYRSNDYTEKPEQGSRKVAYASVVLVAAVAYVYRLIFSGDIFPIPARPPAASPTNTAVVSPAKPETNKFLCQIQVDTDPPGASILGDNFEGTSSTGTIAAPCGQAVVIRIEKIGFETIRIPVDTATKTKQILPRVNLQPVKEGSVILTVDNNAKVEIDGRLVGEAKANVPTEYRLAPGFRKFIFKNEILGLKAVKEIQILDKEKRVESATIKLIDVKP